MNEITYPSKDTFGEWLSEVTKEGAYPLGLLPVFENNWIDTILATFDLLKFPHYKNTLHHKGAHLFYKIIKNHKFGDGNKRSAVLSLYLFYSINGLTLLKNPDSLYSKAKETAESQSNESEKEIEQLEKWLEKISSHA